MSRAGPKFPFIFLALALATAAAIAATAPPPTPKPPAFDAARSAAERNLNCPAKFITGMALDRQGQLWVSSEDAGLVVYQSPKPNEKTAWHQVVKDPATCVACDSAGRVWVGTPNRGVRIFDGKDWRVYDVMNGPLGDHIFTIAASPVDGDIWLGTDAGITRYSQSQDTWSYFTRSEGLPSEQISSLAFAADGTLYAGSQCDGLAIASPQDNFGKWKVVAGPETLPTTATGSGLPTSLINAVLVAKSGVVYVGTPAGLARSVNKGQSWTFLRGADWAAKVKGLEAGPPNGWTAPADKDLKKLPAEDYITALAEDDKGDIWLGHRKQGYEILNPKTLAITYTSDADPALSKVDGYVKRLLIPRGQGPLIARYGDPLVQSTKGPALPSPKPRSDADTAALPAFPDDAKAPSLRQLQRWDKELSALPATKTVAAFLGDDWETRGDWTRRYGRQYAVLGGTAGEGIDDIFYNLALMQIPCGVTADMGSHRNAGDQVRRWIHWTKTDNPGSLYDPNQGYRRQAEFDDHGEAYKTAFEGPDIVFAVKVPVGVSRVSLYFFNKDGHGGETRIRDYPLELRRQAGSDKTPTYSKILAKARVEDFYFGVYKQFVVSGPGTYQIRVARNGSLNATCCGVFIDGLLGETAEKMEFPLSMGSGNPPPLLFTASENDSPPYDLWNILQQTYGATGGLVRNRLISTELYRAAGSPNTSDDFDAACFWRLGIWSDLDHIRFEKDMATAYNKFDAISKKYQVSALENEKAKP